MEDDSEWPLTLPVAAVSTAGRPGSNGGLPPLKEAGSAGEMSIATRLTLALCLDPRRTGSSFSSLSWLVPTSLL